jgi:hypothetical protein
LPYRDEQIIPPVFVYGAVIYIMKLLSTAVNLIACELLLAATTMAASTEVPPSAPAEAERRETLSSVYKTIDQYGNVTYSYSIPYGAVAAEELDIAPGPTHQSVAEHLYRQQRIADTARMLDAERRQRQAAREAAEQRWLERQALLNAGRQPRAVDTEVNNLYIQRPWKPWRRPADHHRKSPHAYHGNDSYPYPVQHPGYGHGQSQLPLPPTSFSTR